MERRADHFRDGQSPAFDLQLSAIYKSGNKLGRLDATKGGRASQLGKSLVGETSQHVARIDPKQHEDGSTRLPFVPRHFHGRTEFAVPGH